MEEDFKLTGPELQVELLKRRGYKEESPRCENCKHYHYNPGDDSVCCLNPVMRMKINDDAYCNYYEAEK